MRKYRIVEKVEHFIEVDDAVNTRDKVLRNFYHKSYTEFDKKKSTTTVHKFHEPKNIEFPCSLKERKGKKYLIYPDILRIHIAFYLRDKFSWQKKDNFLDETMDYMGSRTPSQPTTFKRFKEICSRYGVDLVFDEEFQKKADEYDAKIIERWNER